VKRGALIGLMSAGAREAEIPWEFEREGSGHEIWSLDGRLVAIPRHREINEVTAVAILRMLEPRLGRRWWRR
jgi:mRNA interferase HicA